MNKQTEKNEDLLHTLVLLKRRWFKLSLLENYPVTPTTTKELCILESSINKIKAAL